MQSKLSEMGRDFARIVRGIQDQNLGIDGNGHLALPSIREGERVISWEGILCPSDTDLLDTVTQLTEARSDLKAAEAEWEQFS